MVHAIERTIVAGIARSVRSAESGVPGPEGCRSLPRSFGWQVCKQPVSRQPES
jgi:hypothetical protein